MKQKNFRLIIHIYFNANEIILFVIRSILERHCRINKQSNRMQNPLDYWPAEKITYVM